MMNLASAAAFALLLLPASAWAQATSGITGTVRDDTGGVLPGVQVEARSPALIEQVRTVYTDGQGLYRIVDLVPGQYTVTYTLPGFRTVIRDGITLTAAFTATVSAEMAVGGIEESITVSGAAPVVDTRNVAQQLTVPSEIRDAIPLPTSSAAYVVLIPGATQAPTNRDVGGMRGEQAQVFGVHGTNANNLRQMRDGMDTSSLFGGGNRLLSLNPSTVSEVIVQTVGDAKVEGAGALVDVVLRDGGNQFSGTFVTNWGSKDTQSNNIDDDLVARGTGTPGDIKSLYDYSYGLGGPIVGDQLWFYSAGRRWLTEAFLPGIFFNATQGTPFYTPDESRPSFEDNFYYEFTNRLTWQAAEKHKVTFLYSRDRACQCHVGQRAGTLSPEAAGSNNFDPNTRVQSKWTYPVTSRLLLDGGASMLWYDVVRTSTGGGANDFAILDNSRNFTYGHHARSYGGAPSTGGFLSSKNWNFHGNVAYVTGSHNFQSGVQYRHAPQDLQHFINNGFTLEFRGTTPVAVTEWASPFHNSVKQQVIALYAQDQWTLDRLTVNLGLRFDYLKSTSPAFTIPAGPRVPERQIPAADDHIGWKDLQPRLGAAYDLFGDGHTALKVALGRYVPQLRFNDQQQYAPARQAALDTDRSWTDLNGDFIPQDNELGPRDNENFGLPVQSTEYSREVTHGWRNRPYNYQASVQVDHQLDDNGNFWASAGYFRTWFGNFNATDNRAVSLANYDEYSYTVPSDPDLPGGGGQVIAGLHNQKPGPAGNFGAVDRVVVLADSLGSQTQVYNGIDLTMRGRFPNGVLITGGVSFGKTVADYCGLIAGNPQLLIQPRFGDNINQRASVRGNICREDPPWSAETNIKFSGIVPLPAGFQVAATWQNLPAIETDADFVVSPTAAQGQIGRRLTGGGADRLIRLYTPKSFYVEPRANQIDFRISKRFQFGRVRVEPQFNAYNMTNANDVLQIVTRYGAAWQNARNILPARLIKLGLQIDF
jgi:hypothetical protein